MSEPLGSRGNAIAARALQAIMVVFLFSASPCQSLQEATSGDKFRITGMAEGRLEVPPLAQPLKLEERNEIPIRLHGCRAHSAQASWSYYNKNGDLLSPDDRADATVMYYPDGNAYVTIAPEKPGKLRLSILVSFEDGLADSAQVDADVTFPDRKPIKFLVAIGGTGHTRTPGTVYMDLSEMSGRRGLDPIAIYGDAAHPVPIPATQVKFKLITAPGSDPPISIDDSTGNITALRIGHALIQTTFQGFASLTCVDVMEDARSGADRTVCSELVPAGMTAPLSGFKAGASLPSVKAPPKQ